MGIGSMVVKAEREQSHQGAVTPHLEKDRTLSGNSEKMSKQYRKVALHPTSLPNSLPGSEGAESRRGQGVESAGTWIHSHPMWETRYQ